MHPLSSAIGVTTYRSPISRLCTLQSLARNHLHASIKCFQQQLQPRQPARSTTRQLQTRSSTRDDVEVAVFRFTLGIPGFDDANIPRVVGIVVGLFLVANHVFSPVDSGTGVSDAQQRAELLGSFLALLLYFTPTIDKRLEELKPGRGRAAIAQQLEGATNVFSIASTITDDDIKRELAWASYALLCNINICSLMIIDRNSSVVLCRGLLGSSLRNSSSASDEVTATATAAWNEIQFTDTAPVYLADRGSINKSTLGACKCIPTGAKSVYIQPLTSTGGLLVLISDRERALSSQERTWAASIAAKLSTCI